MPDRTQALDLLMLWREAHRQYGADAAGVEDRIVWREEMDRLRLEYLDAVDDAWKASIAGELASQSEQQASSAQEPELSVPTNDC